MNKEFLLLIVFFSRPCFASGDFRHCLRQAETFLAAARGRGRARAVPAHGLILPTQVERLLGGLVVDDRSMRTIEAVESFHGARHTTWWEASVSWVWAVRVLGILREAATLADYTDEPSVLPSAALGAGKAAGSFGGYYDNILTITGNAPTRGCTCTRPQDGLLGGERNPER